MEKSSKDPENISADRDTTPRHVGIIMDGNGRWAAERDLPRIEGHRAGAEATRQAVEACRETGVTHLTLYAFSTENWRRPPDEIKQLMSLLRQFLEERVPDLQEQGVNLRAIGRTDKLPKPAQNALNKAIQATQGNARGTLTLALNYGGREEILHAARQLALDAQEGVVTPEKIDESVFAEYLYTADLPDPDLIIRTSGEQRLSNFLTWQSAYAELWFTSTYWPDFSKEEFRKAVNAYSKRDRRFGR